MPDSSAMTDLQGGHRRRRNAYWARERATSERGHPTGNLGCPDKIYLHKEYDNLTCPMNVVDPIGQICNSSEP